MIPAQAFWIAGAYIIGSIPTGYWIGKSRGVDVRQHGSGNLGATNVFRVLGLGPGITTLIIDMLKGFVPVFLCQHAFPGQLTLEVTVGIATILGHATSPFVGFKGGKGVATSGGVAIALLPMASAIAIVAFLAVFALTRIVSLSSIISISTLAISSIWWARSPILTWTAAAMAIFVIWTHRANIKRLIAGKEPRLGRVS